MGSTFSSAFENIHLEYRAVSSTFSFAYKTKTQFEYRAMGSTFSSAFENIHLEYRAVSSTFSSAFKIKHTLNIELWVRHSALHSKTYILNIEL